MKTPALCLPLTLLLFTLGSCASTSGNSEPAATGSAAQAAENGSDANKDEEAQQKKVEGLEHKLEVARIQLDLAVLAGARGELDQTRKVTHAQEDVDMAAAALENFTKHDKPGKLGRAKLSLETTKEMAAEAAEELLQLEIMYKDQDLEEMTSEFVLNRGRRRAARAAKRIEFQEIDFEALTAHTLPLQQQKLTLALTRAEESLEAANADTAKTELNRRLKLIQAEMAVKKAADDLEEAKSEGASA